MKQNKKIEKNNISRQQETIFVSKIKFAQKTPHQKNGNTPHFVDINYLGIHSINV